VSSQVTPVQVVAPSVANAISRAARSLRRTGEDALADALEAVEVPRFSIVSSGVIRNKGRHLEIVLASYSETTSRILNQNKAKTEAAIRRVLGGTGVTVRIIDADPDSGWARGQRHLGRVNAVPVRPDRCFDDALKTAGFSAHTRLSDPLYRILARHTRWSVTVATGQLDQERPIRMTWWLSQWARDHWIREAPEVGADESFEQVLHDVSSRLCGMSLHQEAVDDDPAHFGQIDRHADPLRVRAIGPRTEATGTWKDVEAVFRLAASSMIRVTKDYAGLWLACPLAPYVDPLREIAESIRRSDESRPDVVLVFRGGTINNDDVKRHADFRRECLAIRDQGVELVVAIGHSDYKVWDSANVPIGIHEAITPTAGALWVLQHHLGLSI
jgi:hypothetical protein